MLQNKVIAVLRGDTKGRRQNSSIFVSSTAHKILSGSAEKQFTLLSSWGESHINPRWFINHSLRILFNTYSIYGPRAGPSLLCRE